MAKISRRRLAREVVHMLQQQPANRQHILQMVAAYLIDKHQDKMLHLLLNDIAGELLATQHQLSATATTVFGLNAATRQQITDLLKAATGAQAVDLAEQKQPDLLGGVVVRTPGYELDASVATRIKQIAGGIA